MIPPPCCKGRAGDGTEFGVLTQGDYTAVFDASPDAQVAEDIRDTILGVKRMIRGLLPPELDHGGLSSALGSVFRDIEDVYGFTVHASLGRVGGELDEVATLALYRIVQEAVGNAVRHAGVSEATVTFESANGTVTATIRDEGCGFDAEGVPGDGCVGLAGMHERAALVGGSVVVQTSPDGGTTVRASVPVQSTDGRNG